MKLRRKALCTHTQGLGRPRARARARGATHFHTRKPGESRKSMFYAAPPFGANAARPPSIVEPRVCSADRGWTAKKYGSGFSVDERATWTQALSHRQSVGLRNKTCQSYHGPHSSMKCGMECDEWTLVEAFIRPADIVLELGARFGTTSCALAAATQNSGHVVAVEPDKRVIAPFLMHNRDKHNCSFAVLEGVVGTEPQPLMASTRADGYGTTSSPMNIPSWIVRRLPKVPAMSIAQLEAALGRSINVALFDCEGCIESVLTPRLARQLELILWEEDGQSFQDIRRWYQRLVAYGFSLVWRIHDTFDPMESWSRHMFHSVWLRRPHEAGGEPWRTPAPRRDLPRQCLEYKASRRIPDTELLCAPAALTNGSALAKMYGVHSAHFAFGRLSPGNFDHTCERANTTLRPRCSNYTGIYTGALSPRSA
jgi:FkbM family methyltransferase